MYLRKLITYIASFLGNINIYTLEVPEKLQANQVFGQQGIWEFVGT